MYLLHFSTVDKRIRAPLLIYDIFKREQAEAEVVPSSSLVEIEVEVDVGVEVGVEVEVGVGVEVGVEV